MVRESNWSDWSNTNSDWPSQNTDWSSKNSDWTHHDGESLSPLDVANDLPLAIPTPAKMQETASIIRQSWSLAERQRRALIAFYVLWRERLAMARANNAMDRELRRVRPNLPSVRWPQPPQ